MRQNFPGFLYAKSLRHNESLEQGYRTWFLNSAIKPYDSRIESLRTSFHWRTDSFQRHSPVVVMEPVGGSALIVRFIDAGKDTFGRPQTLRMEAFLVPAEQAAEFWDGSFFAEPDADRAEFQVETDPQSIGFPGLREKRIVNGNSADFFFEGRTNHPEDRFQPTSEPMKEATSQKTDSSAKQVPRPSRQPKMKKLFFIVLFAFLASFAINVLQFDGAIAERKALQNRIAQREQQLNDLRTQLDGLEADKITIAAFRNQSRAFTDALKDLERVLARLNGIRTAMDTSTNVTSAFETEEEK